MNTSNEKKIRSWSLLLSLCGLVVVVGGWALAERQAPAAAAGGEESVLAKVGEETITRAEVEEAVAAQLRDLERQRHEAMEQGLERAISDTLIGLEAAARSLTVDELLAVEVNGKAGEISEVEVDAFYAARKDQINRPKEQVEGQIREFLAGQRRQQAYQNLVDSLREKYGVESYLDPMRVQVASEGFPSKGPEDAAVTIVEFSDFECPFCSRVNPTLDRVREEYADSVRLVFRQFPLSIHPNAWKAAEASLCAHEQGEFWAMHDAMFADQKNLGVPGLKAKAEEIGLDMEKFDVCLEGEEYRDQVQADFEAGQEAGVSGTPAMFVNGRFISGAVPFEQIASVIDNELARMEAEGGEASGGEAGASE